MATVAPSSLNIIHDAFARRMKQACDANEEIPPLNDGRLVWMQQKMAAEGHDVSLQTVMRWYYGAAMPRQQKIIPLSKVLGVNPSWLALGQEEHDRIDTSQRRISTEGAVNAFAGHLQMAGIPCAFPEKGDPKADLVHFYCIIAGRQHPFHVVGAAIDRKSRDVVFQVPMQHKVLVVILIIPIDFKTIEVWRIPTEVIEQVGEKESDMKTVSAILSGRILSFGAQKVKPISDFSKSLLN